MSSTQSQSGHHNWRRFQQRPIALGCNPANPCYTTFSTGTELEVLGGHETASLQSRRQTQFRLCLPADSPVLGPYWDLHNPRKYGHSIFPLNCRLIHTFLETNRSRRRNWIPHLSLVVLQGTSPGPLTQICIWIPHRLCHPSFWAQHCGDLSPSLSSDFFDEMCSGKFWYSLFYLGCLHILPSPKVSDLFVYYPFVYFNV